MPPRHVIPPIVLAALCSACGQVRPSKPANQDTCPAARVALARWSGVADSGQVDARVIAVVSPQDSGYAPVRNGLLSVRSSGVQRSQATDTLGRAIIRGLPDGPYIVTVRGMGFETRVDTITVSAGTGWHGEIRLSSTVRLCCRTPICL